MKPIRFCLVFFLTWISLNQLIAQESWKDTELKKSKEGVTYFDYRHHRNPTYFFKRKLKDDKDSVFVHLFRGKAIVELKSDTFLLPRKYSTSQIPYKIDIQVKPLFSAEYGDFREPVRTQLAIGPRLELAVGGLYGVFQWVLPFQNDFKNRFGSSYRPGEVGIGFTEIIKGKSFLNLFIGTFTNDRYGAYSEFVSRTTSAKFYYGFSAYYTGRFLYEGGTLFREDINYFSGNIFAQYKLKYPDVNIRLTVEKFLRSDFGATLDVFRQFGNTDIGFNFTISKNGENAGIYVILPLWPRKFYSNDWIQIRPPHSFQFTYDLRPNTGIAEKARTYNNFFTDIYRFNLPYLNNELKK